MRDYVIMTDSCCDLPAALADEMSLLVLPMCVTVNDRLYHHYLDGRELSFPEFYEAIRNGAMPTTSAISVGEFEEAMREVLSSGRDLLYLGFSSALSTTFQSACIAAEELRAEFPEAKLYLVDSLAAAMGEGLFAVLCAQQQKAGKTIDEVRDYAESIKQHVTHRFTVDDLNHLKRGGRVSAASAMFGTMLAVKPVLNVDSEGRLIPLAKVRGRKASLLALVNEMETMEADLTQPIWITHGDCEADAQFMADEIRSRFGVEVSLIHYIGPVIGAHTGVGAITLFFVGKGR